MAGLVFAASQRPLGMLPALAVSAGVWAMLELVWEYSARHRAATRLSALTARRQDLRVCVDCGAIHEHGNEGRPEVIELLDIRVDVLLEEGKKVEAVKAVLDAKGAGLKDAMDRVRSRERE